LIESRFTLLAINDAIYHQMLTAAIYHHLSFNDASYHLMLPATTNSTN